MMPSTFWEVLGPLVVQPYRPRPCAGFVPADHRPQEHQDHLVGAGGRTDGPWEERGQLYILIIHHTLGVPSDRLGNVASTCLTR